MSLKRISVKLLVFVAIAGVITLATVIPVETKRASLFSIGGGR